MSFLFTIPKIVSTAAKATSTVSKVAEAAKTSNVAATAVKVASTAASTASKAATTATKVAEVAKTSKAVSTAAKVAVVGGGVAAGGTLAGLGVQNAIVKPFEDLGLVTTTTDAKGDKQKTLTTTGKVVAIGLAAVVVFGIFLYGVGRVASK